MKSNVYFRLIVTDTTYTMKGVVIFDDRSNLAYYSLDKEMKAYMSGRMQDLEAAARAKLSQHVNENPQKDMRDILGDFFLPLYTTFVSPEN